MNIDPLIESRVGKPAVRARAVFCAPVLVAAMILSVPACNPETADTGARPNIVLISLDNLAADHMGCYGYGRDTTPFLDSLARSGVLFERTTAQDTWTLPSHASLLTSRYASAHGVVNRDSRLSAQGPVMLQETLQAAGYSTAAFTTCLFVSPTYGFERGFEHFKFEYTAAEKMFPHIMEHLSAERLEKPFFLFLHFFDIHHPFIEKNPYGESFGDSHMEHLTKVLQKLRSFAKKKIADLNREEIEWLKEHFPNFDVEAQLEAAWNRNENISKKLLLNLSALYLQSLDPKAMDSLRAAYDNGIANMDMRLSKLFERLKAQPWFENTLFVITSDHGEAFNQHSGIIGHGGPPFRELSLIPLILTGAGAPAGRRIAQHVAQIDIAPTVLDLAGLASPDDFQGISLAPLLRNEAVDDRPIISGSKESLRASLEDGRWKLVTRMDSDKSWLFDVTSEEDESLDRSAEFPDRAESMKKALLRSENYNQKAGDMIKREAVDLDAEAKKHLWELGYMK